MIEIGASILLLAPLAYIEDFLRQSFGEINAALRSSVAGLSAVRELLPPGARRTAVFDELLEGVRERAADGEFPQTQITALVSGDGDDRTVALAAMVGAPSSADGAAILGSIRRPGSGNEQYYALLAADAAWERVLTVDERARILEAIDKDDRDRQWISGDPNRKQLADALRAAVNSSDVSQA
ncbi:MAG: hypothetical protein M3235_02295 [Actinomycetota bacterium]|nr:hypothetical protein [Actinomycetota bacterium]